MSTALRPLALLAAILLLLTGAAAHDAAVAEVRYVIGAGMPTAALGPRGAECADVGPVPLGAQPLPVVVLPQQHAGSACIAVPPGAYLVRVVDDAGAEPSFWLGAQGGTSGMRVDPNYGGIVTAVSGGETEHTDACQPHESTLGAGARGIVLSSACGRISVMPAATGGSGWILVWRA